MTWKVSLAQKKITLLLLRSKSFRISSLAILFLSTLIFFYTLLIQPPLKAYFKIKRERIDLTNKFKFFTEQTQPITVLDQTIKTEYKNYKHLFNLLPDAAETTQFIEILYNLGLKNTVQFSEIKDFPPHALPHYVCHPIAITVSGKYFNLVRFMNHLINLQPMTQIEQFVLQTSDPPPTLSLTLKLNRYTYLKAPVFLKNSGLYWPKITLPVEYMYALPSTFNPFLSNLKTPFIPKVVGYFKRGEKTWVLEEGEEGRVKLRLKRNLKNE